MSENELYEVARKRVDGRNRRRTLWGIDLAGYLISIGVFIMLVISGQVGIGMLILMAWTGVFVLHTVLLKMAEERTEDIEKELSKLREINYEKPKRVQVADDGELVDFAEEYEQPKRFVQ